MKRAAFWLGIILLIGILTACGGQDQAGDENANTQNPPAANQEQPSNQEPAQEVKEQPQAPETAELTIVTPANHTAEAFNQRFGDAIREKFPHYTINYIPRSDISFDNLLVTNTMVDIVYAAVLDFGRGPVSYGMVYDMSELIEKHDVDLDRISVDWYDGLREMWEDNIYALPVSLESMALFYNKDIFDNFGIAYPKDGITWDEVFELNERMTRTEGNTDYIGISFALAQHFSLNSLSVPYVDAETETATFNKYGDEWRALYETIAVRPFEATGYREKTEQLNRLPHQTEFMAGEAAMFAGLVHSPLSWADMQNVNWDLTSYPTYSMRPNTGAQGNLLLFGITNMSQQKEAAMEVIKYLLSDEYQKITSAAGNIPIVLNDATISAFAQDTYYADRNVQSIFSIPFAPLSERTLLDPVTTALYRSQLLDLAFGNVDMNTMMRTIEQEINLELEIAKKQQ